VKKETSFGSSVRIVGSISQLGTWDPESSLAMGSDSYTTSDPLWEVTLTLPCGTTGEYKYILDSDGTKTWESTGNRNFAANSVAIAVQDSWESSAAVTVTNAPSSTTSSTTSTVASTTTSTAQVSATACSVTFIVDKTTQNGQTVNVVGSNAKLGSWNPTDSIALSDELYMKPYPMWYAEFEVPFDSQYKYILTSPDGATTWESTPNRNIDGDACRANGGKFAVQDTWENESISTTIASHPTTTSSAKPTATACRVTFIVKRATEFGESIHLVGSASQLGAWDAATAVALDASDYTNDNPVWSTTLTLPLNSAQYKYILASGGTNTWEADPNHDFDAEACASNGGSLTVRDSWQFDASTPTGSNTPRPSPTQEGLTSDCSQFYLVQKGDGCYDIAHNNGISPDNFDSYNPSVGADCSNLYPDYYVCVGVSGSVAGDTATQTQASSGSAPAAAPGPTQAGIVSTCDRYLQAKSGEYCTAFSERASVSTQNLYQWNSVLGSNGENCSAKFWAEEYYCVGVSS
jgi:hypothetical protein